MSGTPIIHRMNALTICLSFPFDPAGNAGWWKRFRKLTVTDDAQASRETDHRSRKALEK